MLDGKLLAINDGQLTLDGQGISSSGGGGGSVSYKIYKARVTQTNSPPQSSGELIVGHRYLFISFAEGDNFKNVLADYTQTTGEFTALDSIPFDWSHGTIFQDLENYQNTVQVLENTFGVDFNWFRDDTGKFIINGSFPDSSKVFANINSEDDCYFEYNNEDEIFLFTKQNGVLTDGLLNNTIVTIVVYSGSNFDAIPFLKNQTINNVEKIRPFEAIFNPSNLTIPADKSLIVETNADYYVLGDIINRGVLTTNGTVKIGGGLVNYGVILGNNSIL